MHPSESCRREPPPMTRPRPSASFLKSAEASAAAQRHRTGRMATSRAHVRLAASAPTSTVLARRATRMPRLSARAPTPRAGVFPTVLRLRAFAAVPIARARPRGSPEPPLRAIRALHPPRRVAIISRSASASWPLGPGGPAPDPRTPRPDHDDVSIPEWALIQIPRVGDDESARTTPEETESEPNGERETRAGAWRGSSPLAALSGAFATTTTTTTTGFAARAFAPRAAVVAVFAAAVIAAAHLFGAGAGVASPIVASITPVVFLTHGATVSHAAAMVAQGLHAWANNVVGVAATATASAASGAAGYAAARRAAAAELAELRAELTALRRMVAETAAIAMVGGEKTAADASNDEDVIAADASGAVSAAISTAGPRATAASGSDPVASSAVGDTTGIGAGVGAATEAAEADARARAEAELAALRRQLARHRAVWRPGDRDGADDDAPSPFAPDASIEAAPAMRTTANDARVEELAALRAELAALRSGGDGWMTDRSAAKSDASSSATDGDACRREEGFSDAAFDPTAAFWSDVEPTPPNAAAFASSPASIPRPGTGTGVGDGAGDGAGEGAGDWAGTGTSASGSSDVVDWAALAKSRAVWAPPGTSGSGADEEEEDDGGDSDGASGGFGAGRFSEDASEAAARARLDEEDATWRRRLNLGEDRSKDEDDDETGGSRGGIEDGCGDIS